MIELNLSEEVQYQLGARLKVLGIGGAGGNVVGGMIDSNELNNVEFIVANTDAQALNASKASYKIQLGGKITKGLGAGSNPDLGRRAAEEDLDAILEKIADADILFLTAGLGGGTGTGALPVVAKAAKELGILTVAIVTKPFLFEGRKRLNQACDAIDNLKNNVDTMIVVPNQKLLEVADPDISMLDAFSMSDGVLKQAVKGISDIITKTGYINVDFADVKHIMKDRGLAIMGIGVADGQDRAKNAALKAITSPLIENMNIANATGVLINIAGNVDLGLQEINDAASLIYQMVSEDTEIILGSVIDKNLADKVEVIVIATGIEFEQSKDKNFETFSENVVNKQKLSKSVQQLEKEEALRVTPSNIDSTFDSSDLDTPTFLRKKHLSLENKTKKSDNVNGEIQKETELASIE